MARRPIRPAPAPPPYAPLPYQTCLDLGAWGALYTRGWDRAPVKVGSEGKAMKRQINTVRIYPPATAAGAPRPPAEAGKEGGAGGADENPGAEERERDRARGDVRGASRFAARP